MLDPYRARNVEQALISSGNFPLNQINSISPFRIDYEERVLDGMSWLTDNGYEHLFY